MDWQTLDSAPLDGTTILAWHEGYKTPFSVKYGPADKTAMGNEDAWHCIITGAIYPPQSLRFWQPSPTSPQA